MARTPISPAYSLLFALGICSLAACSVNEVLPDQGRRVDLPTGSLDAANPLEGGASKCGNGVVDEGERCDVAIGEGASGACPGGCDDGDSCTADKLLGQACQARCEHQPLTTCDAIVSDGCCPAGCNSESDVDCSGGSCGNGVLDPGERCDTAIGAGSIGSCPSACDDGNSCTAEAINGAGCDARCEYKVITTCKSDDGCCPPGCASNEDNDCSASCGNGVIEAGETCDTAIAAGAEGACRDECDDQIACTEDKLVGSGCNVTCASSPITLCRLDASDGCCPTGCTSASDVDCPVSCGNEVVEGGETCDTAIAAGKDGACPTACDDQVACTIDRLVGGGCTVACSHVPITGCSTKSDGCCPVGCNSASDPDCPPGCGNGVVDAGETCDTAIEDGTPGACVKGCNDNVACTADRIVGSACTAECSYAKITTCSTVKDGCCPAGCNSQSDADCSPSCGDGVVDAEERCDTAIAAGQKGACPSRCDDQDSCTADQLVGSKCSAQCAFAPITRCSSVSDGCCPESCDANTDSDCTPVCGNGVVEHQERCDSGIPTGQKGACPKSCDDGKACTTDRLQGAGCSAYCTNTAITNCSLTSDGCCAPGCNANTDADCQPGCGNGVVEANEACDTAIAAGQQGACPTDCGDGNVCTQDLLLGTGCSATCENRRITACLATGDSCCPAGCNANTDADCAPVCGNGAVERGERCDSGVAAGQSGACPTTCDDHNSCTVDALTGTGCGRSCTNTVITRCSLTSDGCCPAGCNANTDADCAPSCGNGAVERGEQCDTAIGAGLAGACPTSCDDRNTCTTDVLSGTACGRRCTNTAITACSATADSCCPSGCNANDDVDCGANCGNGVLEGVERCDTAIAAGQRGACPTSCNDNNSCTTDALTGSACSLACSHTNITACATASDGCCPAGCTANTDGDCSPVCGNGAWEKGERCDTAIAAGQLGSCPTSCDDNNSCTADAPIGNGCDADCSHSAITRCSLSADGCCPAGCNANTDADCGAVCGNGAVERGERCDSAIAAGQAGACPTSCNDNNRCTTDGLLGSACSRVCDYVPITRCLATADGCCPAGCNANTDGDCIPICGNGVRETGELCDTTIPAGQAGACPTSCNDGQACTSDSLVGSACGQRCSNVAITSCLANADGCCPSNCNANNDRDCAAVCGNGVLEAGERCDTRIAAGAKGACPTSCDDGQACTADALVGSACGQYCTHTAVTSCSTTADGCCPSNCNANNDPDCTPVCGNGVVESRESCDTAIGAGQRGACPTSCEDNNACTTDSLVGSACTQRCNHVAVTACSMTSDGCCPAGCTANNDSDCTPLCGNGALEAGERCDTGIGVGGKGACPTSCNDGRACTADALTGSGCGQTCTYTPITACSLTRDGCCPAGCNANTDGDCTPLCGNGVFEAPESCDTAIPAGRHGACPTSCDDNNACTTDTLTGSGCTQRCSHVAVTACSATRDGCCPAGCNANNDADCTPICGNGVVEPAGKEFCDTGIAAGQAGACPTSCDDNNACTSDGLVGAGGCQARCGHLAITACSTTSDGCCPAGCNANTDADCTPICGNGVLEGRERCDTGIPAGSKGACPTSCEDNNACTNDSLFGTGCARTCLHLAVTTCAATRDGCCPAACNANNDGDCAPICGNGVVEPAGKEFCDTSIPAGQEGACPTSCNDNDACTTDLLRGPGSCQARCYFTAITACSTTADGCCPSGCTASTDADCPGVCGNGILERGETCDTRIPVGRKGACPTACNDGLACTSDLLSGAGSCTARCVYTPITRCSLKRDGCCPKGCTVANDGDCGLLF